MKAWKRFVPLVVIAATAGLYLVLCLSNVPQFYNVSGPYLGPSVNTPAPELCPRVSPDGRYLFFLSSKSGTYDAYWIDAQLLEQKQSEVLP